MNTLRKYWHWYKSPKQQKPLELKHVLGFCLYVVITAALIINQHADKIAAYVKGLKIL